MLKLTLRLGLAEAEAEAGVDAEVGAEVVPPRVTVLRLSSPSGLK